MSDEPVGTLKRLKAEAGDALDDSRLARRDSDQISRLQAFIHFWVLVSRSFARNRCPLRASSLAYASLLAMVPMLAVVISVSSSLLKRQGEEPIQRFIDAMVERMTPAARTPAFSQPNARTPEATAAGQADHGTAAVLLDPVEYERTRKEMATKINGFISNIRSGTLGVTGMVALMFVAISMLSRIEGTFNDIWGVTHGRSWFRRIVQYWAALTLGPILLAVTFTLTSGPHFEATKRFVQALGPAGAWTLQFGMALLPYVIWSLAFAVFYQLMPNTKVHFRAALAGGVMGGCLWQLNSEFSVLYVSRVVTNSRIYGSVGMIPVFMIGLYFAWLILLFGAQVAYAFQNRRTYLQERQAESVHQQSREFIALRLASEVARRFRAGEKPPTLTELSDLIGVPTRLAGQLLRTMVVNRLLAEVIESESAYVPARPLANITAMDILMSVRTGQGMELRTREGSARTAVLQQFTRIAEAERVAGNQVTLEEMATIEADGSA